MAFSNYQQVSLKNFFFFGKTNLLGVASGPARRVRILSCQRAYKGRTLQRHSVLLHRGNGGIGDDGLPSFEHRRDADFFPFYRHLRTSFIT